MADVTVQLCYGDMSIGSDVAKVSMAVITPNSQLKGMPSKRWVSKSPMAKSQAHTSISGCGEWRSHCMQVTEAVAYLHITCSVSSKAGGDAVNSVASVVLRITDGAPVLSLHAKIPNNRHSTMINGMVHAFQGRADILTAEEVKRLNLNVKESTLDPAQVLARFRSTSYDTSPSVRRNITIEADKAGKLTEVVSVERRRRIRLRR